MSRPLKAPIAGHVHVQQVARARPLVAVGGLLRRPRRARDAVAAQHLPDRRVRLPGGASDESRPPAGMAPALTDALLELAVEQPRHPPGTTRAVKEPAARSELIGR